MHENDISEAISYKGVKLATDLRLDLIVEGKVVVDLKAKEQLAPTDRPQMLTYLRLSGLHLGLIINFHSAALKSGIVRVVNHLIESSPRLSAPSAALR